MRTVFNKTLVEIARSNEKIIMITADIGYGQVETFAENFPDRFLNTGVAEQNMTGIACGLALEGNIAITYSIGNFPTLRCLEQIRNDVCYQNANVKIVIIGGGVAYGSLGMSHHSTEDLAILRALPNMVVLAPSDYKEAKAALEAMIEYNGPVYYRCGHKNEKDIHSEDISFKIGKAIQVTEGEDAAIIYTGTIGYNALLAVKELEREGIHCRLISMHTVKPIDSDIIIRAARETGCVITVEEHNINGGLGSAVAEVLADTGNLNISFKRIAFPDINITQIGSQEFLRGQYGMSPSAIGENVRNML